MFFYDTFKDSILRQKFLTRGAVAQKGAPADFQRDQMTINLK